MASGHSCLMTQKPELQYDPDFMPGGVMMKRKGCTCPRLDNHFGKGVEVDGEMQWYVDPECPIHTVMPEGYDGNAERPDGG